MADWKLLSFYTAKPGTGHKLDLDSPDGGFPVNSEFHSDVSVTAQQEVFCTGNNLTSCIAFLNQELQLLGLPTITSNNKSQTDVCCLLNRAYDFFRCYQKVYSVKEELENRIQRLSGEVEHHKAVVSRTNRQKDALERTASQEAEKLRQLSSRHRVTSNKLKAEKDEIKCLQSVMHHKDLQFKHELKKKEREINKLKDRLHQMLMDKNPDRKVGMDLMNTVQNTEGKRGQWKPGLSKQEEEMYQMLVGNYEDRHRELVLENTELRDCLLVMQRELSALHEKIADNSSVQSQSQSMLDVQDSSSSSDELADDGVDGKSYLTVAELNEGYYQMPYDMVRKEIERAFRRTCQRISVSMKRTWKQKPEAPSPNKVPTGGPGPSKKETSHDLQQLQTQISKYKDIIQQQEQLIQQSLQTHSDSFLHESQLLHEKDVLAKEKKLFYEEKAHFEEERKLFTEAAIKLGRERKAVHDEKLKFLKEHFMNLTPFQERQNSSHLLSREGGGGTRLLPATPTFSPAHDAKVQTPNTEELFRTIGLGLSELPREKNKSSTPRDTACSQGAAPAVATPDGLTPSAATFHRNLFSSPGSVSSDQSVKSDNH